VSGIFRNRYDELRKAGGVSVCDAHGLVAVGSHGRIKKKRALWQFFMSREPLEFKARMETYRSEGRSNGEALVKTQQIVAREALAEKTAEYKEELGRELAAEHQRVWDTHQVKVEAHTTNVPTNQQWF
jgi:hypothetical protein